MLPSAAELVARFLRSNGYSETLETFVTEADLLADIGTASSSTVTIDSILHEKKAFDLSLNFEKLGVDEADREWATPAPARPTILETLHSRSNILSVAVFDLLLPSVTNVQQYVVVTTADRCLHLLNTGSSTLELARTYTTFQDSPILDITALSPRHILVASMSGKMLMYDTVSERILDERKDHSKYVVKIASWSDNDSVLVASAGWDSKVFFYRLNINGDAPHIGTPVAVLTLSSIPETLLFVQSPEDGSPMLLVARRDSTFLYYYSISSLDTQDVILLGKQNLAPHSNAWVAFTPADVQICPSDPSVVAVATSSTPHMKLLILKLLLPPPCTTATSANTNPEVTESVPVTQASQARAELLVADREEAAILVNVSTMAPQTAYSTPRLTWRPDGSGVYVSSDDGIVRGIEASSGKLVANLEKHEPGSKLRCLWAGHLRVSNDESIESRSEREVLISGGFDQRLIVWER